MNTRSVTLALLTVLAVSSTSDLLAQRRTTGGGSSAPSGGRSTPSGGSARSGGESRRGSGSGTQARPARPSGSSGGEQRPSGSGTARDGQSSGSGSDAQAQSGPRPQSGKIGAAKARARDVAARTRRGGGVIYGGGLWVGGCYSCYYWGGYGGRWGWYDGGWWYPARHPGRRHYPDEYDDDGEGYARERVAQGYQEYPYAEADGTGETFVQRRGGGRRGFGAVSGFFFSDLGSTTQAGHVALEGAIRMFHAEVGYGNYREPLASGTDHLQTLRFSVGAQPALGNWGYLIAGIGARGVFLDDGSKAGGPEGTLGLQVFPVRPIGINVTGRLAAMSWTGRDHFAMSELNTTGSVFLGRVELQAGWHWMKMEGSPGFGGPMVGTRIWF